MHDVEMIIDPMLRGIFSGTSGLAFVEANALTKTPAYDDSRATISPI